VSVFQLAVIVPSSGVSNCFLTRTSSPETARLFRSSPFLTPCHGTEPSHNQRKAGPSSLSCPPPKGPPRILPCSILDPLPFAPSIDIPFLLSLFDRHPLHFAPTRRLWTFLSRPSRSEVRGHRSASLPRLFPRPPGLFALRSEESDLLPGFRRFWMCRPGSIPPDVRRPTGPACPLRRTQSSP